MLVSAPRRNNLIFSRSTERVEISKEEFAIGATRSPARETRALPRTRYRVSHTHVHNSGSTATFARARQILGIGIVANHGEDCRTRTGHQRGTDFWLLE